MTDQRVEDIASESLKYKKCEADGFVTGAVWADETNQDAKKYLELKHICRSLLPYIQRHGPHLLVEDIEKILLR